MCSDDWTEKTRELLSHFEAVLFWVIQYSKKNSIPLDGGLDFHLSRIQVLLDEMANPPSPRLAKAVISDDSYHKDSSDEDLTEPQKTSDKVTRAHRVLEGAPSSLESLLHRKP